MIESNDQGWGLCDHGPVGREFDDDAEEDYGDAWDEFDEQDDDDDESPMARMARVAADIEAGSRRGPARLETRPARPRASWCGPLPSGQRYASTLTGEWLPVPAIGPDRPQPLHISARPTCRDEPGR